MVDHHNKQTEMGAQEQGKAVSDTVVSESKGPVTSRRKFAKAGLTGGAVLASLSSRPALGSYGYGKCSVSVLASVHAGSSAHPDFDPMACEFGCSHDYWCQSWGKYEWERYIPYECRPQAKFCDVFRIKREDCKNEWQWNYFNKSLWECISYTGSKHYKMAARWACIALLNCIHSDLKGFAGYGHGDLLTHFRETYYSYKRYGNDQGLYTFCDSYNNFDNKVCPLPRSHS